MVHFQKPNFYIFSDKCNIEVDCNDKTDEQNCKYLRLGSDYAQELVPRDKSGSPTVVYMNISILALPSIEVMNLKFTVDFYLNLRWNDFRINFLDLNTNTILNSLSLKDLDSIWVPKLGFTNALGPYQTIVDNVAHSVLIREDDPLPEDYSLYNEGAFQMHV